MSRTRTALLAALLFSLVANRILAASPSALDPSFGRGGVLLRTGVYTGYLDEGGLQNIRVLADGRILVVSTQRCGTDCRSQEITRLTSSGATDGSYNPADPPTSPGRVELESDFFGGPALTGLAVIGDGRLVSGSDPDPDTWCCGPFPGPGLTLVAADGTRATASLSPAFTPLDTRPGGDIIGAAAGALVRLRSDLTRDPSFGVKGAAALPAGLRVFAAAASAHRVRVAATGSHGIVLVTFDRSGRRLRITRVPVRGWAASSIPGQMAVRGDGSVVISAWLQPPQFGPPGRTLLIGFRPDGRLAPGFGRRGVLGIAAHDTRIAAQPDGRIVVLQLLSGPQGSANDSLRLVVRRLTRSGGWDTTFPARAIPRPALHAVGGLGLGIDRRGRILLAAPALTPRRSGFRLVLARLRGG